MALTGYLAEGALQPIKQSLITVIPVFAISFRRLLAITVDGQGISQLFQQLALMGTQAARNLQVHQHPEITAAAAIQVRDSLPPNPELGNDQSSPGYSARVRVPD